MHSIRPFFTFFSFSLCFSLSLAKLYNFLLHSFARERFPFFLPLLISIKSSFSQEDESEPKSKKEFFERPSDEIEFKRFALENG